MIFKLKEYEFYKRWKPIMDLAIPWIESMNEKGINPTLRGVFYHMVATGQLINCLPDYRNFGRRLNDAKEAGKLDWDAIVDDVREWVGWKRYESTDAFMEDKLDLLKYGFTLDYWKGQPQRPEVWLEKNALISVIEPVCREFQVPYYPLVGWGRPADKFAAVQRFAEYSDQLNVVLHAGDHDATGCWVTHNLENVLQRYGAQFSKGKQFIRVRRIGLSCPKEGKNQVSKLPPNRIGREEDRKEEESRWAGYLADHDGCKDTWELDALEPEELQALVRKAIRDCIKDKPEWDAQQERIRIGKSQIRSRVARLIGRKP
jgi:hypothetical protein